MLALVAPVWVEINVMPYEPSSSVATIIAVVLYSWCPALIMLIRNVRFFMGIRLLFLFEAIRPSATPTGNRSRTP